MLACPQMVQSMVRSAAVGILVVAAAALGACGGGGGSPDSATLTYCDVAPILASKCQRCHTDPPEHGAPFPLLTYADTQEPSPLPDEPGRTRASDMFHAVESDYMPYKGVDLEPPVSQLTCQEKTTLLDWLGKGGSPPPEAHEDCQGVRAKLLPCAD